MAKKEIDIDVTVESLEKLVEIIRRQWVGDDPDREYKYRAGTLFIAPDGESVRLDLRFPLDVEAFRDILDQQ